MSIVVVTRTWPKKRRDSLEKTRPDPLTASGQRRKLVYTPINGMSRVRSGRVLDPAVVAADAEEKRELPMDLVFQVLLGQGSNPVEQRVDLKGEILREVLLGEDGRRRVGDGLDADDVERATTGLERAGAVPAEELRRVVVHDFQQ
jgi:hypothetical protein